MDYKAVIQDDLNKGFSKVELERLIGLPKNNLSGIMKGDRELSKKSILKIEKWMASEKPNPLDLVSPKQKATIVIQDLNTHTNKVEPKKKMGSKKSNFSIDSLPKIDAAELDEMERMIKEGEQEFLKPKNK